jgi:hypothetical protein
VGWSGGGGSRLSAVLHLGVPLHNTGIHFDIFHKQKNIIEHKQKGISESFSLILKVNYNGQREQRF